MINDHQEGSFVDLQQEFLDEMEIAASAVAWLSFWRHHEMTRYTAACWGWWAIEGHHPFICSCILPGHFCFGGLTNHDAWQNKAQWYYCGGMLDRWLELDRGQEDDDHDIPQPWWQRSNSNNHNGRRRHNHYHMDNEDDRKTIGRRWRSQPYTCSRRFSPCLAPLVLTCFDHRIDAYSKRNIGLLVAHASGQPCQILKHALGWVDCVTGRFEIISYIRISIYIYVIC